MYSTEFDVLPDERKEAIRVVAHEPEIRDAWAQIYIDTPTERQWFTECLLGRGIRDIDERALGCFFWELFAREKLLSVSDHEGLRSLTRDQQVIAICRRLLSRVEDFAALKTVVERTFNDRPLTEIRVRSLCRQLVTYVNGFPSHARGRSSASA